MKNKVPDTAPDLISRLIDFYNNNPDYETTLLDIYTLTRLAHQEMEKFIHRPHTKVTKIYFDKEAHVKYGV